MTNLPSPERIAECVAQEHADGSALDAVVSAVRMDRVAIVRWMGEESDSYDKIAAGHPPGLERATAAAFAGTLMLLANDLEASMAGLRRSKRDETRPVFQVPALAKVEATPATTVVRARGFRVEIKLFAKRDDQHADIEDGGIALLFWERLRTWPRYWTEAGVRAEVARVLGELAGYHLDETRIDEMMASLIVTMEPR